MQRNTTPGLGAATFFFLSFVAGAYFCIAAVQGNYGLLKRAEVTAEAHSLRVQLDALEAEIAAVDNRTLRLSDDFLDLDLLDQQARDILGMVRSDDIILR